MQITLIELQINNNIERVWVDPQQRTMLNNNNIFYKVAAWVPHLIEREEGYLIPSLKQITTPTYQGDAFIPFFFNRAVHAQRF